MDEKRWAAAYFRVERESAGVLMRKGQRRKATKLAIEHGDPVPLQPSDVVRIFDRDGEVVLEQNWGDNRSNAMTHEAQIVDDLLHLDVLSFCGKYGIDAPELPDGAEASIPPDSPPDAATFDEAPGRSDQGSG